jgi:undecaprenyl-diphosphatase
MDVDFFRASFLAILQGFTEFLPISSSAHIILPKELFGWPDQGLVFDVAVHVGSLLAVLLYFRHDIVILFKAWIASCISRTPSADARLAWFIIAATIPAGLVGFLLNDIVEAYSRSMFLIAFTSIFFAILLYVADRIGQQSLSLKNLTLRSSLIIGFFQMLALLPGTSRSGATMTAALFCGLDRRSAARFSFLLAIPIIAAGGFLEGFTLASMDESVQWGMLVYAILLSALVSWLCIHYFLVLIERVGFMPFIIYRIVLGLVLFVIYFAR